MHRLHRSLLACISSLAIIAGLGVACSGGDSSGNGEDAGSSRRVDEDDDPAGSGGLGDTFVPVDDDESTDGGRGNGSATGGPGGGTYRDVVLDGNWTGGSGDTNTYDDVADDGGTGEGPDDTGGGGGTGSGNDSGTTSGTPDGGGSGGPCRTASNFDGQVGMNAKDKHSGGRVGRSISVYTKTKKAKIQDTWDWIENNDVGYQDPTTIPSNEQIEIRKATVTSTATSFKTYGNQTFYIQDREAAIKVQLQSNPTNKTIEVGDKVSFTVTKVQTSFGRPFIAGLENFRIESRDNEVYIRELTGQQLRSDYLYQLVRVTGDRLTIERVCGGLPDSNSCGENDTQCKLDACKSTECNLCYAMEWKSQEIATFRSDSFTGNTGKNGMKKRKNVGYFEDTCLTYVGPMGMFWGPLADSSKQGIQLDAKNRFWTKLP